MPVTELLLLWLGTMALLIGYVGIARASDKVSQIVSLSASMVFWAVFALQSTNFLVYSGGQMFNNSVQSLAVIGVVFGFVTFILLLEVVMRAVQEST